MNLIFATGNTQKYHKGQQVCGEYGIDLAQNKLEVDEVQSEDAEYVARKKADAAYSLLKKPVIISDDSWDIAGLNGFPGTYAKSINTWLTADDLIRLTRDLTNRNVIFRQILVYQDESVQQLFVQNSSGILLKEARGTAGVPTQKVISLEPDGKHSISEMIGDSTHYQGATTLQVWHEFARWLKEKN